MAAYLPVRAVRRADGVGMPVQRRMSEAITVTSVLGTPMVFSSGNVAESADPVTAAVVGFSAEVGHNLTAAATAEDGYSEATPQNQASAKIIPMGAWMKPGDLGVYIAEDNMIFSVHLIVTQVFTQAMVGTRYELNKDGTTGFWILDNTDSGTSAEHIALVVGVDDAYPNTVADARVLFKVPNAVQAL